MKRVLMLLANGVEPLEMAAFTDVLGWADLLGDHPIELINAGLRSNIVTTFGLSLNPSFLLQDLDISRFDALALPGGFEPAGFYDEALSEPFLAAIRQFVEAGKNRGQRLRFLRVPGGSWRAARQACDDLSPGGREKETATGRNRRPFC